MVGGVVSVRRFWHFDGMGRRERRGKERRGKGQGREKELTAVQLFSLGLSVAPGSWRQRSGQDDF